MKMAQELFVAENVSDLETIVYALKRNIPMPRLYCVIFIYEKNRYELISSWQLCRGRFHPKEGVIVGVANGKRMAYGLMAFIIEEAVKEQKDLLNPSTWIEGIMDDISV
ncbi:hypothetical protein CLNEO_00560 [Anaerotignum neopropionicum]|uniref:Uncharacterized protein n=1 Tax=Anaerotignum neopropionicum TaxID=36847 RepID=A0A136WHG1_9FIRM|nr:hypothetical protein [Anaerotignum neopropionicum]KXL53961.1 hypothetical protein CLNEO_00560 [Anaerotignum neopropionicum]